MVAESDENKLLLSRLGHYVAGVGGEAGTFELYGDVVNGEGVVEFLADGDEDGFAFVHVHIGDAGVAAQCVVIAAEGPDVDVVNFLNAGNGEDGARDFFDLDALRAAFEKNVRGSAQDADAGPQNEKADGEAEDRVNPSEASVVNGDGAADDSDVRERVAEIVDKDAAEVEVFVAAHDGERDAAVDGERGEGGPDHPALDDGDGSAEALNSFVAEPRGEENEENSVCEGGERAGAMVAVGFVGVGGTLRPAHGDPGDAERGDIGKIVDGVV